MLPNGFQPAESLDEANERLRKLEYALAVERDRVRRMTPIATFEEEEEVRREVEAGGRVSADEVMHRLFAGLEGLDGQR